MNGSATPAALEENLGLGGTETDVMNNGDSTVSGGVAVGIGAETEVRMAPMTATVMYSASGYSPSSVTIKKGGTVTWVDQGTGKMWIASASHPTHTVYAGTTLQEHCDDSTATSFDQCENGTSYSFTFEKTGTWRYHSHSQASHFGSVTVVE